MRLKTRRSVHRGAVTALGFSPDGTVLVSAGRNDACLVWHEVKSGKELGRTPLGEFEPHALSLFVLTPNDVWVTRWPHPRARVCHFNRVEEVAELGKSHLSWVYLTGARNRRVALSGGNKKGLVVWDVGRGEPVGLLPNIKGSADAFALSFDGARAVTLGYTNHVLTGWDVTRCKPLWKQKADFSGEVTFSSDGTRFLDTSETLEARDFSDGEVIWSTEAIHDALAVEWGPNDRVFAATRTRLCVLEGSDGRLRKEVQLPERLEVMALSDDGKQLVIGTETGELLFF